MINDACVVVQWMKRKGAEEWKIARPKHPSKSPQSSATKISLTCLPWCFKLRVIIIIYIFNIYCNIYFININIFIFIIIIIIILFYLLFLFYFFLHPSTTTFSFILHSSFIHSFIHSFFPILHPSNPRLPPIKPNQTLTMGFPQ